MEYPLITDLALILIVAAITTVLCRKLKQPLIVGYLLAGFMTGPYWPWFPTVHDSAGINTWSQIGMIFLLFALGLEFNFKQLLEVGKLGAITTLVVILSMMGAGFGVGAIFGWDTMTCTFLGGLLAMSSTMIVIKAFEEMNLKGQPFTKFVYGIEVVEDLAGILLMVLLSAIAVSQSSLVENLSASTFRLVFFMVLWFVGGIFIVPTLIRKLKNLLNDETLLVLSIGLCLGMVWLAEYTGFSAALGAFVIGSILGQTSEAQRIEELMKPLKDLFGAVFFVAVGMMANPSMITDYWLPILLITLTVAIGKSIASSLGVFIAGKSLETSMKAGFSLGQIGEFAYIIALLGINLKVTGDFLYPIAIAVSVITTFTTPFMIKATTPCFNWIERRVPAKYQYRLKHDRIAKSSKKGDRVKVLVKYYFTNMLVMSVIIIGVITMVGGFIEPLLQKYIPAFWASLASLFIMLLGSSPFLSSLILRKKQLPKSIFAVIIKDPSLLKVVRVFQFLRIGLVIGFLAFMFYKYSPFQWYISLICVACCFALVYRINLLFMNYIKFERQFLFNYNAAQLEESRMAPELKEGSERLSHVGEGDWLSTSLSVAQYEIDEASPFLDKSMIDLNLRAQHDLFIIRIEGKQRSVNIPAGREVIQLHDIVYIVGKRDNLRILEKEPYNIPSKCLHIESMSKFSEEAKLRRNDAAFLRYVVIPIGEDSGLVGKTLAESGIGYRYKCLVVGIEYAGRVEMNPSAQTKFETGSYVWVVGEEMYISTLLADNLQNEFHFTREMPAISDSLEKNS